MKELSIEEKAKAYDDAIDKIKYVMEHGVSPTLNKEDLQDIFPELKESEDERIRGAIIDHLKDNNLTEWAAWLKKQGEKVEPKSVWSEEDEKMFNQIISIIEDADDDLIRAENISIYTNWFKSLKDRVKPKQKWSEEDERMYRELHNLIYSTSYCDSRKEFSDFLNSLKDRVQIKPQQEWSEEDNYYRNHIIQIIEEINNAPLKRREDWESYINWLKSLGPQNHWKPSDEQMKALNYVVNLMASSESPKENDYYYNVFKDLRKQLKKLKEGEV